MFLAFVPNKRITTPCKILILQHRLNSREMLVAVSLYALKLVIFFRILVEPKVERMDFYHR